jgi:hypothetical protein
MHSTKQYPYFDPHIGSWLGEKRRCPQQPRALMRRMQIRRRHRQSKGYLSRTVEDFKNAVANKAAVMTCVAGP